LQLSAAAADKSTRDRQQKNAVALLSIVGNVVLEKMCKVFGGPDAVPGP